MSTKAPDLDIKGVTVKHINDVLEKRRFLNLQAAFVAGMGEAGLLSNLEAITYTPPDGKRYDFSDGYISQEIAVQGFGNSYRFEVGCYFSTIDGSLVWEANVMERGADTLIARTESRSISKAIGKLFLAANFISGVFSPKKDESNG